MEDKLSNKYGKNLHLIDTSLPIFREYTIQCLSGSPLIQTEILDNSGDRIFLVNEFSFVDKNDAPNSAYYYIMHLINNILFKNLIETNQLTLDTYINFDGKKNVRKSILIGEREVQIYDTKVKLRFYRDFTALLDLFYSIETILFCSYIIFFTIFFCVILYQTTQAQDVINKHSEVIQMLSEAKKKAEFESETTTKFLANISHELRTPLNAIIGFSEIIIANKNDPKQSSRYLDYINDIHNSGSDLLSLINDILDYSKASANKLTVNLVSLKIDKIVHYCMRSVEPKAKENKIKLILDLPENSPVAKADSLRVRQALLNLISNAIKFTDSGGSVKVSVKKISNGRKVEIRIIDTGRGMAKEDIPRAMGSFHQLDNTKNRHFEGTGLGLPLTKKLVELMKGKLKIESELGKGTVAIITFKSQNSENK
jgi:signal transduction histidine kinase